jgi:hypothetical protein
MSGTISYHDEQVSKSHGDQRARLIERVVMAEENLTQVFSGAPSSVPMRDARGEVMQSSMAANSWGNCAMTFRRTREASDLQSSVGGNFFNVRE